MKNTKHNKETTISTGASRRHLRKSRTVAYASVLIICLAILATAAWRAEIVSAMDISLLTTDVSAAVSVPEPTPPGEPVDSEQPSAVFTVTNDNNSGAGSLRQAIADANALTGADTINFDAAFFATPRVITLTTQLAIIDSVTINGPGANRLAVSGGGVTRVFAVSAANDVTLSGMLITSGNGGGTPNSGQGGGIVVAAPANLTVLNCTVTSNTATVGGGILTTGVTTLSIINSTISNNTSGSRGGGISASGNLTVSNSTVSGNTANGSDSGGGIYTVPDSTITNSTITNNTANGGFSAGGIYSDTGTATMRNSIVAGNVNNAAVPDVKTNVGSFASNGYNLIGNRGTVTVFTQTGDQAGDGTTQINPRLGPLVSNGGTTLTHAPLGGSPALDKGSNSGSPAPTTDQRGAGFTRVVDLTITNASGGDGTDIGAFEAQSLPTCGQLTPITVGTPVNGTLALGDCTLPFDGSYFDAYTFSGTAGQQISIALNSAAFDAYLFLQQGGTAESPNIAQDNNSGGGTNARIPATGTFTLPANGTYTILANSFTVGQTGAYTLTLSGPPTQTLAFSSATYSVGEAGPTVTLTVSRTGGTDGTVTANYTFANLSATGGAACGGAVDFVNTGGTVTLLNGEASKTFTVAICDDAVFEGSESFNSTLSNPTGGATIGSPATATVTINDNEVPMSGSLQFSSATYSGGEAGSPFVVTVTRTAGSDGLVTVNYATSPGTATGGAACGGTVDYVNTNGTLLFANGETSKTFNVTICNDSLDEANETINYTLSNAQGGATIGTPSTAAQTIIDDDQPTPRAPFDFDGDQKTDVGIFRSSDGSWWYSRSSDTQFRVFSFGVGTDKIVPGDYTGDGKTDIAVFRPSTGFWFVQRSEDNSFFSFPFGTTGDVPMPADYDGDGKTDAAVFRPSSATWFILNSGGSGTSIVGFGASADKPVAADYDGDSKADIAIFRPSDGSWWYLRSSDAQFRVFQFGVGTDKPVQGDFTGDGKADIAVFRQSTGTWFIQRSEDNSFFSFPFGTNGDIPTPGDYDGDGKFDAAVFRPSAATWFINRSTAGVAIQQFGTSTDTPIPAAFVP